MNLFDIQSSLLEAITGDGANAADLIRPSEKLTPEQRIAIYRKAYFARLLGVFRETFPGLRHALGEPLLDQFALQYLQSHPPRTYSIDRVADHFAAWLSSTRPREPWADFVVQLATLELALSELGDCAGLEGKPIPSARDVDALGPSLLQARPTRSPALRLFAESWPVSDYLQSLHQGENPSPPEPASGYAVAARVDYRVTLHRIDAIEYALLTSLDGNRTVDEARGETPPSKARDCLCRWANRGWLASI